MVVFVTPTEKALLNCCLRGGGLVTMPRWEARHYLHLLTEVGLADNRGHLTPKGIRAREKVVARSSILPYESIQGAIVWLKERGIRVYVTTHYQRRRPVGCVTFAPEVTDAERVEFKLRWTSE